MDIKSLYTNISINLGLSAIKYWTEKYPQISKFQSELILEACNIVLNNNSFIFNNENFIQINGTAMGTKIARTHATLTLGYQKEKLYNHIHIDTLLSKNYFRYLDDANITKFIEDINNSDHRIEFIIDKRVETVNFLDLTIYKREKRIETDLFYKKTDSKQYLHYYSNHQRHIKNNVPFKGIVSKFWNFLYYWSDLNEIFTQYVKSKKKHFLFLIFFPFRA